jgi:hypothetical protein
MRCFSFPDYDLYESMEHEEYSSKERRYDFCKTPPSELIQYAGIGKATFYRAIQSLINEYMIQEIADGFWKVYIRPQHWYKHEKLNEWTRKRFHYYRQ